MVVYDNGSLVTSLLEEGDAVYVSDVLYFNEHYSIGESVVKLKTSNHIFPVSVVMNARGVGLVFKKDDKLVLHKNNFIFFTEEEYKKEKTIVDRNIEIVKAQKEKYGFLPDIYTSAKITGEPINNLEKYIRLGAKLFTFATSVQYPLFGKFTGLKVNDKELYLDLFDIFDKMSEEFVANYE